jgi:hypothetical protein
LVYFERAVAEGLAELSGGGRLSHVTYKHTGTRQNFNDPEEQLRPEFWAELIYRYGYEFVRNIRGRLLRTRLDVDSRHRLLRAFAELALAI